MSKYTLDSGRCIVRDGVSIATVHGVTGSHGYTIGSPADLDDFAHAIVKMLDWTPDLLSALIETLRALEAHLDEDALHAGFKHRDFLCPCNKNEVARAHAVIRRALGDD